MFRILLILCLPSFLFAQTELPKTAFDPCGSPVGIDPWLARYVKNPDQYNSRSQDTLTVGVQVHLLATDAGGGRFSTERLLNAFCRLNSDFEGTGIRFYFKNPWNLVNKTSWYKHSDIPAGIQMMLTNDVPDALNSYFVQDPAGNCGYSLPYGGVAINHSCANANDHTWAHEIGHTLSLPHPFLGWEGKTYSYNTPTPELLTYDYTYFHDTLDTTIPAPLDTALVEYLDGSNCALAADLFCDTKPDYLSYRWSCDAQNNSLVKHKDPSGADFYADGTLFMSYSSDECQNRFSPQQIAAMRANLLSEKSSWLYNGPVDGKITAVPNGLSPVANEITADSAVTLRWSSVPNAAYYYVLGSRIINFAARDIEFITTDTTAVTGKLISNKKYYWKVRPFNNFYTCTNYADIQSFITASTTAVKEPNAQGFRCYPNILTPGATLILEQNAVRESSETTVMVLNAAGQICLKQTAPWTDRKIHLEIPAKNWPQGVYQVLVIDAHCIESQRFILAAQ
ncbi:MAG: hypothetical protein WCR52_14115 [Bacteroidota bacterium]